MQNLHAIHITYLGPTNTKGSRVKLTSKRFKQSVTLYRDYSSSHALDQAIDYLTSRGFSLVATRSLKLQLIAKQIKALTSVTPLISF